MIKTITENDNTLKISNIGFCIVTHLNTIRILNTLNNNKLNLFIIFNYGQLFFTVQIS